jgi:hypothetical protein
MCALLAPASDDQQRVVDRDTQTDERDQEPDDARDVGDRRQAQHDEEARHDRDQRDQQRNERQERPEHEREHEQRADGSEQCLGQEAEPARLPRRGRERIEAAEADGRTCHGGAAQRRAQRPLCLRVLPEAVGLLRGIGDEERGAAVARDERAAARRGVRGDAAAGHGLFDPGGDLAQA